MAHIVSSRNGITIGLASDTIGVMRNFSIGETNKMVVKPISQKEYDAAKAEYKRVQETARNGGFVNEFDKGDAAAEGESLTAAVQAEGDDTVVVTEAEAPSRVTSKRGRKNKVTEQPPEVKTDEGLIDELM